MKSYLLVFLIQCFIITTYAQTDTQAVISVDACKPAGKISPLIFGQFIEFLGRCIDGGIYEEGSPLSDKNGFRSDVLARIQELNTPLMRFPGGTVVKIYHWEDGTGIKAERPKRKNLIWGGINDNHFGTAEFIEYCHKTGAEPFLVVNMSTGTAEEASNWVEYCNGVEDSYYANLRRSHGYEEPFDVKYWGIGNEENAIPDAGNDQDVNRYIEESWQFVKLMKLQDPSIKITLVGHPEDLVWSRKVISEMHQVCDYLSVHFYVMPGDQKYITLLRSVENFNNSLDSLRIILNGIPPSVSDFSTWYRFPPRSETLKLAIDEWGIWDINSGKGSGTYNLEYQYNWAHALAVGKCYNMFQRNADIIGLATWAQTVNVLAPIMTNREGLYVQTVYTPISAFRKYIQCTNLPVEIESPLLGTDLKALDATASISEDKRTVVIALLNLAEAEAIRTEIRIKWTGDNNPLHFSEHIIFTAPSLQSVNTFEKNSVEETKGPEIQKSDNGFKVNLKPASINFLIFKL